MTPRMFGETPIRVEDAFVCRRVQYVVKSHLKPKDPLQTWNQMRVRTCNRAKETGLLSMDVI